MKEDERNNANGQITFILEYLRSRSTSTVWGGFVGLLAKAIPSKVNTHTWIMSEERTDDTWEAGRKDTKVEGTGWQCCSGQIGWQPKGRVFAHVTEEPIRERGLCQTRPSLVVGPVGNVKSVVNSISHADGYRQLASLSHQCHWRKKPNKIKPEFIVHEPTVPAYLTLTGSVRLL